MRRLAILCCILGLACNSVKAADPPMTEAPLAEEAVVAMSFADFCAACEHLEPGEYTFVVVHPYTCCPVTICICVPCGCYCLECKCNCFGSKVVFDYPGLCNNIVIKFKKNGAVVTN